MRKFGKRLGLGLGVAMLAMASFVGSASAAVNADVLAAGRAITADLLDTIQAFMPLIASILAIGVAVGLLFWFARKSRTAVK